MCTFLFIVLLSLKQPENVGLDVISTKQRIQSLV